MGAATYADLLDQALRRELGAGDLALRGRELEEGTRRFNVGSEQQGRALELEREKLDSQNSLFNKILSAASVKKLGLIEVKVYAVRKPEKPD